MKHIILFSILVYSTSILFGQSDINDKKFKKAIEKELNQMKKTQKKNKPKIIKSFDGYFKPELIDTFFSQLIQGNYHIIYDNTDTLLKKLQPKSDFIKYFKTVEDIYGKIQSYKPETYAIKSETISETKSADAVYNIEFENYRGKIRTIFNIENKSSIRLRFLRLQVDDYSNIYRFDTLTRQTFSYMINKEYPLLYNSTSKLFQEYVTLQKFKEFILKIENVDFSNHKLYQSQIGVINNKLLYHLVYDINSENAFLTLDYTETDNGFQLEKINYKLKEEK